MSGYLDSFAYWLADYYLATTVLLAATLAALALMKQPAKRLAVAKAALLANALLIVLCVLPGWSLIHVATSWPASQRLPVDAPTLNAVQRPNEPMDAMNFTAPLPAEVVPLAAVDAGPRKSFSWLQIALAAYALGSAATLLWLALGMAFARRLLAAAAPARAEIEDILTTVLSGALRRPRLRVSDRIDVAAALGVWRPTVLLPNAWATDRSASELRTILAHECAHIRNGDLKWLAASRLLLVALWAQPLYWWLRRQMRLDQESLADAAAAEISDRATYAEQLVAWARAVPRRPRPALASAVGLWESPSQLRRRVALLLDERFTIIRSWSLLARSAVLVAAGVAAIGLSLVTLQPSAVSAESPDASHASDDNDAPSTYSGTVVDKRSEKPVAGATVTVRLQTSGTHPWKTLSETTRETSRDGRFEFTIPKELAADSHLYIELDVAHGEYAPLSGFGYALSMIRKNEKVGGRPFFDRIPLEPGGTVQGTVRTPEGDAAVDVPILAFSAAEKLPVGDFGHSWSRGKTDAQGVFRLNVVKQGKAILWLLPTEYAQQTHVLGERRGVLGTLALENGMRLSGRVADRKGHPIPGIWVNAELVGGPAKQPIDLPVVDAIRRSALTDANGKFELAPLPAGTYRVLPGEFPAENPGDDRQPRPLSDVFIPQRLELVAGKAPPPIEIEAVETVTIEAQIYDSAGQRRGGHEVEFFGRVGNEAGEYYLADGRPDADGHIELKVPKGLRNARLTLIGNEHQALRYRWTTGGSLQSGREIELDDLQRDRRGLEIIYYTAPILIVRARDEQGNAIPDFKPSVFYQDSVKPRDAGTRWLSGISGEVGFERQADDSWRSEQLLPGEKFFVTVTADGYQPVTESLSLKEGVTKEIDVTLTKAGDTRTQSDARPEKVEFGKASAKAETQHTSLGGGAVTRFVAGYPATPWDYEPNAVRLEVEDAEGKPVADVEATLYRVVQATGEREQVRKVQGNETGVVEFRDVVDADVAREFQQKLEAGQFPGSVRDIYYIVLKKPQLGTVILPASDFTVAGRGFKRRVRMRPGAELVGRVTDREGRPVAGATVAAGSIAGFFKLEGANAVKTDAAGHYSFTNLAAFDRAAADTKSAEQTRFALSADRNMSELYPEMLDPQDNTTTSDLIVTHPDYAVTKVRGGNVPGTTDVVIEPAAVIEGRVVEFGTGKPAAGVVVKASGAPIPIDEGILNAASGGGARVYINDVHQATTRTDAGGRYRLANLPAGKYDVWAEEPTEDWSKFDWVSRGVTGIEAMGGGRSAAAPDLVTGPGGVIRGQLLDAATDKPLTFGQQGAIVKALFFLGDPQSQQSLPQQRVDVLADGKFELRAVPGKFRVFLIVDLNPDDSEQRGDYRSDDDVWKTGRLFDLQHGERVDAEFRVWPYRRIEELRAKSVRGFELLNAGQPGAAIKIFDEVLAADSRSTSALQGRGQALEGVGRVAEAIADYEAAVKVGDTGVMWRLVELLSTSPDATVRDGRRAVELATEILAAIRKNPPNAEAESMALGLLAEAEAENGDFDAAMAAQREAIEKAPERRREDLRERLKAYEAGRAWRREGKRD